MCQIIHFTRLYEKNLHVFHYINVIKLAVSSTHGHELRDYNVGLIESCRKISCHIAYKMPRIYEKPGNNKTSFSFAILRNIRFLNFGPCREIT